MGETFLGTILNNLMVLLPFIVVRSYQRGVRWQFGKNPQELQPGFHWKLWLYHQVEVMDVVDEVVQLQYQSVITADEKLVCFNVTIGFRVDNIVAHFCNVHDFMHSLAGVASTHLAKRVRAETLRDLVTDLTKLEKSLETTLETRLKPWGTEVLFVGFSNFAEIPTQIRIFGEGTQIVPMPAEHHY